MNIRQSLCQFACQPDALLFVRTGSKPFVKCAAINILHDDSLTNALNIFQSDSLHHTSMLHSHKQFQLLMQQHLAIAATAISIVCHRLQHKPTTIAHSFIQSCKALATQQFYVGKLLPYVIDERVGEVSRNLLLVCFFIRHILNKRRKIYFSYIICKISLFSFSFSLKLLYLRTHECNIA